MFLHGACCTCPATCSSSGCSATTSKTRAGAVGTCSSTCAGLAATATYVAARPQQHGAHGRRVGRHRRGDGRLPRAVPQRAHPSLLILGFFIFFRDIPAKWLLLLLVRAPVLHQPDLRRGVDAPTWAASSSAPSSGWCGRPCRVPRNLKRCRGPRTRQRLSRQRRGRGRGRRGGPTRR